MKNQFILWVSALLALAINTASVQAQVRYTTEDKKAIKAYEEGADLMRVRDLSGAEQAFNRSVRSIHALWNPASTWPKWRR